MKRHVDRQALSSLSELNVTPLVDLAFVLLIIFVITTPFIERAIEVEVPASTTADQPVDAAGVRVLTIQQGGNLLWGEQAVSAEDLPALMAAWKQEAGPDAGVVLRADRQVPVETLVAALDAVKSAGIPRVGIATQPVAASKTP